MAEEIFKELETLKDTEFLYFHYQGDNLSSNEDNHKFQILNVLIDDKYLYGDISRPLGNQNEMRFHVRLTDSGYVLLDNFNKGLT